MFQMGTGTVYGCPHRRIAELDTALVVLQSRSELTSAPHAYLIRVLLEFRALSSRIRQVFLRVYISTSPTVEYKLCHESLAYSSGNTTSMKIQLAIKHSVKGPTRPSSEKRTADVLDPDAGEEDVKSSLKSASTEPALKLACFLAAASKSSERITELIVNMLTDDLLPINTVTYAGFAHF